MNQFKKFFLFVLLAAASLAWGQSAETRQQFYHPEQVPVVRPVRPFEPEFNAALTLSSRYMRDGWCRNSDSVALGQAELTESGLYLGTRSTFDFTNKAHRRNRFQDARFYMGFGMPFTNTGCMGPVVVDICWTYNLYPDHAKENSGELSLAFQLNEIWQKGRWAQSGDLTFSHNYDKNETYAVLGTTLYFVLREDGSLQLENSALLYWGDTRKLRRLTDSQCDGNAFYTAAYQCSLPWHFKENWTLTPFVEVDIHPDGRARKAAKADDFNSTANFLAGLRLSCHF